MDADAGHAGHGALSRPPRRPPKVAALPYRWKPVVTRICAKHKVSERELLSGVRLSYIVPVRHEIWWVIHTEFGASYKAIGRRFGGFNHASVLYGVKKWARVATT